MKKLLSFLFIAALFTIVLTSCEEDGDIITGGGNEIDTPPSISFVDEAGFLSKSEIIAPNQSFSVKLALSPGSTDLNVLRLFEDGTSLPISRFQIAGLTANNPLLILGDSKKGVTYEITILPNPNDVGGEAHSYAFEVEDDGGLTDVTALDITVEIPFTDIETSISGALLNQAGPSGTGGLDLDSGESTGSSDAAAEIQDEGINLDKDFDDNWRRQIAGVNGSVVRSVDLGAVAENLTFADIIYKEQIVDAFDAGTELSEEDDLFTNANGTKIVSDDDGNEKVSKPIVVGDVFGIVRDGKYYLIQCTAVNVTADNNNDNYQFDIKY